MPQAFTDPASGRQYTVDPVTGESRWLDQAPPPPPPAAAPPQPSPAPGFDGQPQRKPNTVAGIVGLIVAVIGLMISWVPIVNNVAFVFALLSGILSIIGIVATRPTGRRSARWTAISGLVITVLTIVIVLATQAMYGKALDEVSKSLDTSVGTAGPSGAPQSGGSQPTVDAVKFGGTVTFKDSSTLTCETPVSFKRDQFAAGGENAMVLLKVKCTFTNRSGKTFEPGLTSGSMTADGVEGESVFQQGLDAPDNPVLSGRSVTWWMGYGLASSKDVQLTVRLGFLGYDAVTFIQ